MLKVQALFPKARNRPIRTPHPLGEVTWPTGVSITSALLQGGGLGPAALWSAPAPMSVTVSVGRVGEGFISVKPCNKDTMEKYLASEGACGEQLGRNKFILY